MPRLITLLAAPFVLAALSGCATPIQVHDVRGAGVSKIGRTSAEIAHSRALAYKDTIELIQNECRDMARQRRQYIADAERYRSLASKARFDEGLTVWERKAYAEMYRTIAVDREAAAARYKELIGAYEGRISIISSSINQQQADAIDFQSMKAAQPK